MITPAEIAAALQVAMWIQEAAAAARKGQTTPEQAEALRAASELKVALAKKALAPKPPGAQP